ncbi:hypothetical protein BH11ARM2_BH11ARM2_03640 [soil metagenome]
MGGIFPGMKGLAALSVVLVPLASSAAETSWKASPTTPEAFAARLDGVMRNARHISAQSFTNATTFIGRGRDVASIAIESPTVFHVEYAWTTEKAGYKDWMNYVEVADGQMFARKRVGGWKDKGPIATRPAIPGSVLASWPLLGPARLLGSIGTAHRPIANLIREAKAAKANVVVERTLSKGFPLERLHIMRKGAKPVDIRIVIDPNRGLPVSMASDAVDGKGRPVKTLWAAKWNLDPNQKLRKEFFQFIQ